MISNLLRPCDEVSNFYVELDTQFEKVLYREE